MPLLYACVCEIMFVFIRIVVGYPAIMECHSAALPTQCAVLVFVWAVKQKNKYKFTSAASSRRYTENRKFRNPG